MLNTFEVFKNEIQKKAACRKVLLWNADDAGWLRILTQYHSQGLVDCTLLGDRSAVELAAQEASLNLGSHKIVSSGSLEESIAYIKKCLEEKSIDILIRGNVGIRDSLRALLKTEVGFKPNKKAVVSGLSCHYVSDIERLLIVSDPIVNPAPDLNRKIAIVNNAVAFAHKLGGGDPRVALLAAVEAVYPVMQHTLEGAAIAKMNDRGQIKGCLVDGPLSMDCAVIESAAKSKGVKGEVGGFANVLIAPNIETGYGMNKAFAKFVGAPTASLVVGGRIPYVVTSRWDSDNTKENSLLLAML